MVGRPLCGVGQHAAQHRSWLLGVALSRCLGRLLLGGVDHGGSPLWGRPFIILLLLLIGWVGAGCHVGSVGSSVTVVVVAWWALTPDPLAFFKAQLSPLFRRVVTQASGVVVGTVTIMATASAATGLVARVVATTAASSAATVCAASPSPTAVAEGVGTSTECLGLAVTVVQGGRVLGNLKQ